MSWCNTEALSDQGRKTRWQLEGNSPEAYERYLVSKIFTPWAKQLIDLADLHPGDRVLDVACGTGIVARQSAQKVGLDGLITGLDVNEWMFGVAQAMSSGITPQIRWQKGDATNMPFSDGEFSVVFCQQGLQFFPNPFNALCEMHRVLALNGRLAFSIWRPIKYNPGFVVMVDALKRHAGINAGAIMLSPFTSWNADKLRELLIRAGFQDVHIGIGISSLRFSSPAEFLQQEAASSPLTGIIASLDKNAHDALVHDIAAGLEEYTDDDGIIFPMESYLVIAHK